MTLAKYSPDGISGLVASAHHALHCQVGLISGCSLGRSLDSVVVKAFSG